MNIEEMEKEKEELELVKKLGEKIKEELKIEVPFYILDEIIINGTKENIYALIGLAKINNRLTEEEKEVLVANIDKYLV